METKLAISRDSALQDAKIIVHDMAEQLQRIIDAAYLLHYYYVMMTQKYQNNIIIKSKETEKKIKR